ncbi:MAG TPA: GNAT family N-acetyltransferase [Solirubrobacteraceae bacterium]
MESHQTSAVFDEHLRDPRFFVRPLVTSDRAGLAALFARLSAESRRQRFLAPKVGLSERELTYFTEVDHIKHEALAAVDAWDGSILGVARYVQWPDRPGVGEVAIEVADDLQRSGIGLVLAQALVRRAHENGLAVLTATTLWENRPARALAHRVGFLARASLGTEIELELYLPTGPEAPRWS